MTTIDPNLESELIRRFPFSPKVRPIVAERLLHEEYTIHHAKGLSYEESDRTHFQFHTPEKARFNHANELKTASTAEKSTGADEKNNSPSELAKLNAKLEEMIMRNSFSSNIQPDHSERRALYESSIVNQQPDNILVRADNQIQRS